MDVTSLSYHLSFNVVNSAKWITGHGWERDRWNSNNQLNTVDLIPGSSFSIGYLPANCQQNPSTLA